MVAANGRPVAGFATVAPPIFRINFGCNDGHTNIRVEPSRIVPTMPLAATEKGCVDAVGEPTDAMKHEEEGFRIAVRPMNIQWFGADRVRLSNAAGSIDLAR